MDGKEQVGLFFVGQRGAPFERDEGVVGPGIDDLGAHAILDQLSDALGDIQDEVFFEQAFGAVGALVVAAMTGIDHHAPNLEAQGADQRGLSGGGMARCLGDFGGHGRSEAFRHGGVRRAWEARLWADRAGGSGLASGATGSARRRRP